MGIDELSASTERYKRHNDDVAASQSRERGSLPPSAPRLPVAAELTPERAKEIAKALTGSHTLLTMAPLLGVSPAEFVAFCRRASK